MEHIVKIISLEKITHDVLKIVTEKPKHYNFISGQATKVSINKEKWKTKKRPFTFTSLANDENLEFTIKTYPEHEGVTNELINLKKEDELILHDVFGSITYRGEGVFIAGGAGITPFISIFRDLKANNKIGDNILLFANKTKADIIIEEELRNLLGSNFLSILSDEKVPGNFFGLITKDFLKAQIVDLDNIFYVCGPPPFMTAIEEQLISLQVSKQMIVKEEF